jgi:hypothetical protein
MDITIHSSFLPHDDPDTNKRRSRCVFMVRSRVKTERGYPRSRPRSSVSGSRYFLSTPENRMSFESRAGKGKNAIFFGGGH